MKYKVVAFEKHPICGQDYTQAVAGEVVGILLEPICECPDCVELRYNEEHDEV